MNRRRSLGIVSPRIAAALVAALILNAVVIGWVVLRPEPWAPLGPYPEQRVELPTSPIPAATLDAGIGDTDVVYPTLTVVDDTAWPDLPVTGQKCATEAAAVVGHYWWREVDPPGFSSTPSGGRATRAEGCATFRFSNRVPDDVRARVREQAASGSPLTIWRVEGEETPTRVDGPDGVSAGWATQTFVIDYRVGAP